MHIGSIQFRLLGVLAIGTICSLIACSGGGGGSTPASPAPSAVIVTVSPETTSIAPGAELPFTATLSDSSNPTVTWAVDGIPNGNSTVGTISGNGTTVTYTAPTSEGTHTLTALLTSGAKKNASINVHGPQGAVSVTLSPGATSLTTGSALSYTATVSGSTNSAVTWTVDGVQNGGSAIGTITGTGNTVTYTAPATTGNHTVQATSLADPTKSASSAISILAPPLSVGVVLSPGASSLTAGTALSLTATVSGSTNSAVTWTVDGVQNGSSTVGTITGTGNTVTYTAPVTTGSHLIQATSVADSSKSASSAITILAPPPTVGVVLSPGVSSLTVGSTLSITAAVSGSTNPAVTWSVDGVQNGNSTIGTITGTGNTITYTAPAVAGNHIIQATSVADSSKSGSSSITVLVAPSTVSVTLSPGTTSLTVGSTLAFTATVSGSTNSAVTWTVDGVQNGNSTIGTITGTGSTVTYTAPATTGSHVIRATSAADSSKSASSSITIAAAPTTVSVSLSLGATSLTAGANLPFTATVSGSTNTAVTWTVDSIQNGNSSVGTITGSGNTVTYTAPGTAGTHTLKAVSAADTSKSASSTLTIQVPVVVSLNPTSSSLVAGSVASFTAAVTGSTNTAVTWTVDGVLNGNSTAGTITGTGNTVTYTAPAAAGSHTLVATSAADTNKSASSSIAVQAPISVSLNPATASITVGATSSFAAAVTGSTNTAVTWKVDGVLNGNSTVGTITGTGNTVTYTGPATAGTHTLIATSAADTSKSASALITVQAAPVPVSVSISPGTTTVAAGASLTFTATITGSTNTGVTWNVDGIQNGNSTVGTISGSGNTITYVAPASGTHLVQAVSVADPTKNNSASVTVQTVAAPAGIIVSPAGLLGNPGTVAAPTTLEGARAILQKTARTSPGTLTVLLRGGIYPRTTTFDLTATDTGTANNPIEYAAYPNETPRIVGGAAIAPSAFHLVDGTDPNWARLDSSARPKIYVADLTGFNLGSLASRSQAGGEVNQAMEVFANGEPMTLARYPDLVDTDAINLARPITMRVTGSTDLYPDVTGDYAYVGLDKYGRPYYQMTKAGEVWSITGSANQPGWNLVNRPDLGAKGTTTYWFGNTESFAGPAGRFPAVAGGAKGMAFIDPADGSNAMPGYLLIRNTNASTLFQTTDPRMSLWTRPQEAMWFGFGCYAWSASHASVSSLDSGTDTFTLTARPTYGLRVGQPFFIYNQLEELTAPGEYYVDRVNSKLYIRPVGDTLPTEILVSLLQTPVVRMRSASFTTWRGVTFEGSRDVLVDAQAGESMVFDKCLFRNAGGWAMLLGGYRNAVQRSEIKQLGKGGIWVFGGDRTTLTPSNTVIENNEIHHCGRLFITYQPAIKVGSLSDYDADVYTNNVDCIGMLVQHNEIHHIPHQAIYYAGNNNTFRYNNIHHVCQFTSDAGAIYSQRDWGSQGNLIQFNIIRNNGGPIGTLVAGLYLDGCGSGVTAEGNIFYKSGQDQAVIHNGGRDVKLRYNIFVGHWYAVNTANYGPIIINNALNSSMNFLQKIQYYNYQSGPWAVAYPDLAVIPNDWTQLQGSHWLQPENCVVYGNLQQGFSGDMIRQINTYPSMNPPLYWFKQVAANLSQVDPMFVDVANLDFRLQGASPMFSIPGFPGIDAAIIGIQR